MIYWDPTDDTFYPDGVNAENGAGVHFDCLQVEQTLDGWHGIVMIMSMVDEVVFELCMVDEAVFGAKYDAIMWCETKDRNGAEAARAVAIYQEDEDGIEFWDAMLDGMDTDLEEWDG